jgi:glutamate-1-semialdehyde 2,1-aminomutase
MDSRKRQQPRETELLATARKLLPAAITGPSAAPAGPLTAAHGSAGRLVDGSDNSFVDYCMGSGSLLLGHCHPAVTEAVTAQLARGTNFRVTSEPAVRLAERIVAAVPCAEQACFTASGSDAISLAMRMVRARRRCDKILKFEGASHGTGDYALMSNHRSYVVGDYPRPVPNSAGIPRSVEDSILVAPFNDLEATTKIVERHHDDIAAIIVEPVQRTIAPAAGFLEGLRQLTSRYDILLIFDENVTGFRIAPGGAQQRFGITPDLCTLGPSISSGLPLGIVCGRTDVISMVDPARYGHGDYVMHPARFAGSPLSCAAALATLDVLGTSGTHGRLLESGQRLVDGARRSFAQAGIPIQITGEPQAFGVWFTTEDPTSFHSTLLADDDLAQRFSVDLLDRGVFAAPEMFFVSTAHDDADIETTLAAFDAIAAQMAGATT